MFFRSLIMIQYKPFGSGMGWEGGVIIYLLLYPATR